MLILITGTPGSGKTLFTVAELLAGQFKDRPLFVNGIPQLLVPHQVLSDQDVEKWHEGGVAGQDGQPSFEVKNAVIVVDEVQRIARPRATSQKVPDWIAALETHRHKGVDFIVITQHPQLLDVNIRRLVGRHLHVRRTFALGAAVVYEWDHCENPGNVKQATSKLWRYPRSAFKLYKSSELHTKAGGKMPLAVWIAIIAVLVTPFLIWKATGSLLGNFASGGDKALAAAAGKPGVSTASSTSSKPAEKRPLTAMEVAASYKPRFGGMDHTAPAYDELTRPKRVPVPAACIEMKSKGCKCYTQDGTAMTVEASWCQDIVRDGLFLAFLETKAPDPSPAPRNAPESRSSASADGFIEIPAGGAYNVAAKVAPPPAEPMRPRVDAKSPWSFPKAP